MRVFGHRYGGAGSSAMRQYKELARDWRRRTLGRRTSLYFWTGYVLLLIVVVTWTPQRWHFVEGLLFGMVGAAYILLPDAVMPDHIARWQRGAWGEQETAKVLKPLQKDGWVVRHDLATGYGKGNRDHIAAGPAVYLLDSKLLKDEVWVENDRLHVRRVGASDDEYSVLAPTRQMSTAARALKRDLNQAVGFPVAVYAVVVIWGHFAARAAWDGEVAYVEGDHLAAWLSSRPVDLQDERKRKAVQVWLKALPRA